MLQGKIIINTRPEVADDKIGAALNELGARVIVLPLLDIVPIPIPQQMRWDIMQNNVYQWLVFTSRNGVDMLFNQIEWQFYTPTLPFKTAIFGERTALALKEKGYQPDLVNLQNSVEDLSNDLLFLLHPEENVLLVLGNLASDMLKEQLKPIVHVDRFNVYRTVSVQFMDEDIVQRIIENKYDMIIFTSPSGVESFSHHIGGRINPRELKTACIGTTTEKALLKKGITPLVIAKPSGKAGLIKGIDDYFSNALLNKKGCNTEMKL